MFFYFEQNNLPRPLPPKTIPPKVTSLKHFGILGKKKENGLKAFGEREKKRRIEKGQIRGSRNQNEFGLRKSNAGCLQTTKTNVTQ